MTSKSMQKRLDTQQKKYELRRRMELICGCNGGGCWGSENVEVDSGTVFKKVGNLVFEAAGHLFAIPDDMIREHFKELK
jgi:hypothetical protein